AATYAQALTRVQAAERALAEGRFGTAITEFTTSAQGFRDASTAAARERARAECLRSRKEAERARAQAEEATAGELAASDFARAVAALDRGDRALEASEHAAAAAAYRDATTAFTDAATAAARVAEERDARAALENVQRLRMTRSPTGVLGRWRKGRADRALA